MTQSHFFHMFHQYANTPFINILTELSLTTNLEVCLDAGDINSYTSGQSWLDRSGNGFDFFLGTSSGAEAEDPTFNGVAGHVTNNEYFGFDGSDQFTYDTTNETWMNNIHKSSAIYTLLTFTYLADTANQGLAGTAASDSFVGFSWGIKGGSGKISIEINNGTSPALDVTVDSAPSTGAWHMHALSVNEAGGNVSFFYEDGNYKQVSASNTFDAAYTSPSASNATFVMCLGVLHSALAAINNGGRMAIFAAWEGTALTKTNLDSIWTAARVRFGI